MYIFNGIRRNSQKSVEPVHCDNIFSCNPHIVLVNSLLNSGMLPHTYCLTHTELLANSEWVLHKLIYPGVGGRIYLFIFPRQVETFLITIAGMDSQLVRISLSCARRRSHPDPPFLSMAELEHTVFSTSDSTDRRCFNHSLIYFYVRQAMWLWTVMFPWGIRVGLADTLHSWKTATWITTA